MFQGFFAGCPYKLARYQERCYLKILYFEKSDRSCRVDLVLPFASDSRKLFKIGVNFSSTIRGIEKRPVAKF